MATGKCVSPEGIMIHVRYKNQTLSEREFIGYITYRFLPAVEMTRMFKK